MYTFRLAVCCMFVLLLPVSGWAAPEFDIQLKELKNPSLPSVSKKSASAVSSSKKTKSRRKSRRYRAEKAEPSAPPVAVAATPEKPVATAMIIAEPLPVEEITIRPGLACKLAGQVADTLAAEAGNIPSLLNGFRLAPVAVAQHDGATAIITCGLAAAEQHTIARLLETRNAELLNIQGGETAEQVIEGVINSLGFSYQIEHGEQGTSYLIVLESAKETMLRLVISPDS